MDLLVGFCSLLAICLVIYLFFIYKFTYWRKRGVPTLPPAFPFGNFNGMGTTKHTNDCVSEVYNSFKGKTPYAGAYFAITPALLVMDLDLIRDIIIKDYKYFPDRPLYSNEKDDPISAHLLAIRGEKWKRLRRIVSPTFTTGKMKYIIPTVVEISNRLIEVLDEQHQINPDLDMKDMLSRFSKDVIGCCSFGIECNSLRDPSSEFSKYGQKVFTDPLHTSLTMFLCGQFPRIARALGIAVFNKDLNTFFSDVIVNAIEFRMKNNIRRNDFLDILIQLITEESSDGKEEKLTINEILAQSFIFFVAGFETTASTLCYAMYELAFNMEIQEKARQEIHRVLTKHDGKTTYEALMDMQYVESIVTETIRKYSPVPRLVRYAIKDYKVPNSNLVVEKDTIIFIPVHSLHNDPDIYPNPKEFNPARFHPDEVQKRHPMAFLGFGDGPRHCIGVRFARMEVSILLVIFLMNFEIRPCQKTPKKLSFSLNTELLNPKDEIYLNLKKIESVMNKTVPNQNIK